MKNRGGIFKLVDAPMKVGARGADVDNDDIIGKMNKIEDERDSSDSDDEDNNEDMGDLDDDIIAEEEPEESK